MGAMDPDTLRLAFTAHSVGSKMFTRRMAINLADLDDSTPKELVLRCERLGLLKPGTWSWFVRNGGISKEQIAQVRRDRACGVAS